MFPLGTVVFPFTAIPLRVFESRYHVLLDRVLEGEGSPFGTVLIERGTEVGGGDQRFLEGTRVQVSAVSDLPEGDKAVVVTGLERIRVVEWLPDDPHPWAEVEAWEDEPEEGAGLLVEPAHASLRRVMALASELGADTAGLDLEVSGDPLVASYQISALSPVTSLDAHRLLTAPGPASRLRSVATMLDEQVEMIQAHLGGT